MSQMLRRICANFNISTVGKYSSTISFRGNCSKSSPQVEIPVATYEEILELPNHPEKKLIDVREQSEVAETGSIPCSVNIPRKLRKILEFNAIFVRNIRIIPVGELTSALSLTDDKYVSAYRAVKPSKSTEVIFSCLKGIRSQNAAEIARGLGYKK